jgi:hypothetical protein
MDTILPFDNVEPADARAALRTHLEQLYIEHRELDELIARLGAQAPFDQLQLRRLKKRKLVLRDTIQHYQSMLIPDIIA